MGVGVGSALSGSTVTAQSAVLAPSVVSTVIVALPAAFAVTLPFVSTVATAVLFDDHVTALLVALEGAIVAVNCCVPPTVKAALTGATLTPVTGIGTPPGCLMVYLSVSPLAVLYSI